jgi:hypothetical protein
MPEHMSTFKEIAQYVRRVEPSQPLGAINYCDMIAELAEAMDRLEYNTARELAERVPFSQYKRDSEWDARIIDAELIGLRKEVPTDAS